MMLSSLDVHGLNGLRMTHIFFVPKHKGLYTSVVEHWTCNQKITNWNPSWGNLLRNVNIVQYCFQATCTGWI